MNIASKYKQPKLRKGMNALVEVLKICIRITQMQEVRNENVIARMILFDGTANSRFFQGRVLPGGVDAQTESGNKIELSARYMLEGIDDTGAACKIFVDNSAELMSQCAGPIYTVPKIITDSPTLAVLFAGELKGVVEPSADGTELTVRIWSCE